MQQFCPTGKNKVNEHVVRITAFVVALIAGLYLFSNNILFLFILLADFIIRGFTTIRFSIASAVKKVLSRLHITEGKLIDSEPKVFASKIGAAMALSATIFLLLNLILLAQILMVVLIVFAFLEAFFGICVACYIYPFYHKIFVAKKIV